LCGQQVDVVRVRRGADPDLIIRLPDGRHAAIALSWTDAGIGSERDLLAHPVPLLAIEGLRRIAALVAQARTPDPSPAELGSSRRGAL
jgi:hypothetical protein